MTEGQTIAIGDKEYALDNLSDKAKAHLKNLRIADQEIHRLQMQLNIAKTARQVYAKALRSELPADAQ
jgi:3-hydroxyisobutyrate dehydrogenase-like beta-hydroxyacid dehydrogenase